MTSITVYEALEQKDLIKAYGIRYQCLTLENGDERYADRTNKLYIDPWDVAPAHVFVASINGAIVGTVRYMLRKEMPFPADDIYDFREIARIAGTSAWYAKQMSALLDRGAVHPDWRKRGIFTAIQRHLEAISISRQIFIHLGLVAMRNTAMATTLLKDDWVRLESVVTCNAWSGYCYLKAFNKEGGRIVNQVSIPEL